MRAVIRCFDERGQLQTVDTRFDLGRRMGMVLLAFRIISMLQDIMIILFNGFVMDTELPNPLREAAPVAAGSSAFADYVTGPACLSMGR